MTDSNRKLLLIGGGGHCKSVLDSILSLGFYSDIGIIDNQDALISGVSVVGTDHDLPALFQQGWLDAFVTVGSIGNTAIRRKLFEMVKRIGFNIPSIIDNTAAVAKGIQIAEGCFIGKKAIVNAGSSLGCCAIINTCAVVEHDCVVGDFSHVSSGAVLCGQVRIGHDTHVGAGSVIRQQISVGNNVLIGLGSVVVKDIPDGQTAYGNPCRVAVK